MIITIFYSLRVCLVHEATAIRSGGFRAIRHVLKTEDDVVHFNNLLIPVLIARLVLPTFVFATTHIMHYLLVLQICGFGIEK